MNVDSMLERGSEHFRSGDFVRAEALYSGVLQVQPHNVKALSNRSATFLKLGDSTKALQDAQSCVRIDPSFVKGWARVGAAHYTMKQYDDALSAYERAAALEGGGEYGATIAELKGLIAIGRGVASDAGRADYYFKRSVDQGVQSMKAGKCEDAVKHFTKAMTQSPACDSEMHVLLCNRSAALLKLGRSLEALDDAAEAVKIQPNYARANVRLAAAQLARNQPQDALGSVTKALALEPQNTAASELRVQALAAVEERQQQDALRKQRLEEERERLAQAAAAANHEDTTAPQNRASAAQAPVPSAASRHNVSYTQCRICSEFGHTTKNCPYRASGH